ncbi:MAG: DUF4150 domain-containing protein [Amaricoccus sp.]|uniref:DUF4150 domain-containing protein n=1 Tax=Amaricoccus sp. TaxID=1872485 RepID=UPI003314D700
MSGVFANGLEVSGGAVNAKTIAAFPDVCFTPPENPATPPGVPVPYPSFGMAGDTDKGTGTVKIGGKTVNIKNQSYLSKTSGTEAGCAAKKGLITSKNTGKEYFNSWSGDVKFDGEPVIRMTDLATNNHASPTGNSPPWLHAAGVNVPITTCAQLNIKPYDKLDCPDGYEKEHTVEVQFFSVAGMRGHTLNCCKSYDVDKAPCICMKAKWVESDEMEGETVKRSKTSAGEARPDATLGADAAGKKIGTPHYYKSADARNWTTNNPDGTLGDFTDTCVKSSVDNTSASEASEALRTECLRAANMEYLTTSMNKTEEEVKKKKRCKGGAGPPAVAGCGWATEQGACAAAFNRGVREGKFPDTVASRKDNYGSSGKSCP